MVALSPWRPATGGSRSCATGNGVATYPPNEVSRASGRKRGAPRRRVLPLDRKRRRGNGRAGARPSRVATYPPNEVSRASGRKRGAPYGAFPLCDGEGAIATGGSSSRSTGNGVGATDAPQASGCLSEANPQGRKGPSASLPNTAWQREGRACRDRWHTRVHTINGRVALPLDRKRRGQRVCGAARARRP